MHLAAIYQRPSFIPVIIEHASSIINQKTEQRDESLSLMGIPGCTCSSCTARSGSLLVTLPVPLARLRNATPLHYACITQNIEVSRLLLESGADWEITDSNGKTSEGLIYEDAQGAAQFKTDFMAARDGKSPVKDKLKTDITIHDDNLDGALWGETSWDDVSTPQPNRTYRVFPKCLELMRLYQSRWKRS